MIRRCALLLLSGALTLAGCGSSGGPARSDTPSPTSPAPTTATTSTPVAHATSVPATVPNSSGVIEDKLVAITVCRATAGGWLAGGTAKGRSGRKAAYVVTVFFTTDHATVQAFGRTRVSVAKGRTATWTVTGRFAATPHTLCVLRGAG